MKKFRVLGILFIAICLAIAGCAGTKDSTRTKAEGTAVGAGVGAVAGGILGYIIGGDKGVALGAALGAGIGGAVGYKHGEHVANEKAKYASQEEWLDACIESAENVCYMTEKFNVELTKEIAALELEVNELSHQYEQKYITSSDLAKKKEKIDSKNTEVAEKLEAAKFELENQEAVLASAKESSNPYYATQLETRIDQLKSHIIELESHTEALATLSQRMAV